MINMAVMSVCLKVLFGRMCDVPLTTVRTILIVRGKTLLAALVGFCETVIWFLVVRDAITTATSTGGGIIIALFYGAGFACGTLIGGMLAKKFIRGNLEVQVVIEKTNAGIISRIRENGFGVSVVDVHESEFGSEKFMLFIEIPESSLPELRRLVNRLDPHAFMVVHETKYYQNGFFVKK